MENIRHVEGFDPRYPRPSFARKDYRLLDGIWGFAYDDEDQGLRKKWYRNAPENKLQIRVPYVYQSEKSGIGNPEHHRVVWYFLKTEIKKKAQRNVLLNFGAVDDSCMVFINGHLVGTHEGGYNAFAFDITDALKNSGMTEIAIRVEDDLSTDKPRGKQSWRDKPWGCWYVPYTGIYRSVYLEYAPATRLKSVRFKAAEGKDYAEMAYEIENPCPEMELEAIVTFKGQYISRLTIENPRKSGVAAIDIRTEIGSDFGRGLWSPDSPDLYEVKLLLSSKNGIDEVTSYFGLRFFRAVKDSFVLNRNPIYLKMVMDQGFFKESGPTYQSFEDIMREVKLIKQMGFNGVRMHQKIEDDRFYYCCDIVGLLCTLEMPSPYSYSQNTVKRVTKEWTEALLSNYNHPSIVMYMPLNESWGVPDITHDAGQQSFACSLYHVSKALDDSRLCISNDGWEHVLTDVITLHNYDQEPSSLKDFYADMDRVLDNLGQPKYTQSRLVFSNGYHYEGQPIFIDEFGGIGFNASKQGWGYGLVSDGNTFEERFKGLIDAIRSNKRIAGYCWTQLTDTYSEQNGLLDENRKPKIPLEDISKIINGEDH